MYLNVNCPWNDATQNQYALTQLGFVNTSGNKWFYKGDTTAPIYIEWSSSAKGIRFYRTSDDTKYYDTANSGAYWHHWTAVKLANDGIAFSHYMSSSQDSSGYCNICCAIVWDSSKEEFVYIGHSTVTNSGHPANPIYIATKDDWFEINKADLGQPYKVSGYVSLVKLVMGNDYSFEDIYVTAVKSSEENAQPRQVSVDGKDFLLLGDQLTYGANYGRLATELAASSTE